MKNIGIIGAGPIGSTLGRKLSALGYSVKIANSRGADSLVVLAAEINAEAVDLRAAVVDVDLVIISIPQKSIESLPSDLFVGCKESLIVVDTGNYYPLRDGRIDELDNGKVESQWVAEHIRMPVLKAFNSIQAASLADKGKPAGDPDRIALPVSGDDMNNKMDLIQLIDALGFDGLDGGTIAESWRQQPGSPVYCTDHNRKDVLRFLQLADKSSLAALRDKGLQLVMQAKDPMKEAREILRGLYDHIS
jgi:predicted dinucleotide-binding enzyme